MSYRISCVKTLEEAQSLWQVLTPNTSVYDTWEFRSLSYALCPYELFFYTAYKNNEPIALLPLQYNNEKGYLEFFGGGIMENNQVFCVPGNEDVISQLYCAIDRKAKLEYILGSDSYTMSLPFLENKYILDLSKFKNFDDYFESSFSGKTKANFKKKLRSIEATNIQMEQNIFSDIERLITLNISHFEKRGEVSSFLFPHRQALYHLLPTLKFSQTLVTTFSIDGVKAGIALSFDSNQYFVFLNAGTDSELFPNIGTYIYFYLIQTAFERGCKIFDAGSDSCNWKERLHLSPVPQYIFQN